MKDLRGTHAAQVRSAIFRLFRLPILMSTNRKKNAKEVLAWKKSEEVQNSYNKLFDDNVIDNIVKQAFPSFIDSDINSDDSYYEICIYTAAVCDLILNPHYPDVECSKKPLELRLQKFKVFSVFLLLFKKLIKFFN